jgi:glycine/D-amino acid oxidase-like deaminating enzyme
MILLAKSRFSILEKQLDWKLGFRKIGSLIPIENENQFEFLSRRSKLLKNKGIQSEIIPVNYIHEVEPLISTNELIGGLHHADEGQIDPFQLVWAYYTRAKQKGLKAFFNHQVIDFIKNKNNILGIVTKNGKFFAPNIILCTGAQTSFLAKKLDLTLNIEFILGQAMVSESIQARLNNDISAASFYENEQSVSSKSIIANLTVGQSGHGNLLLGESMFNSSYHDIRVPVSSFPSISSCVLKYFPLFKNVRILRSWSTAVAFTKDDLPLLGPVAKVQGLYIATGFRSTVIVTPLVGETIAQLINAGTSELDIQAFLPERNAYVSH